MGWVAQEVQGVKVVAVGEPLEGENLTSLSELVASLLAEGPVRLVLDLAHCPHVSSEGLRLFLQLSRRLQSQRGDFALAAPNPEMSRILQISGVSRLVKVCASVQEVVAEASVDQKLAALAQRVRELLARGQARERG